MEDLENGRAFYDHLEPGVGDYFFDALLADLEALSFYAGIHPVHFGFHRSLPKGSLLPFIMRLRKISLW